MLPGATGFLGLPGSLGGAEQTLQLRQLNPAEVDPFQDLLRRWESACGFHTPIRAWKPYQYLTAILKSG
jgi:hypothetical protein